MVGRLRAPHWHWAALREVFWAHHPKPPIECVKLASMGTEDTPEREEPKVNASERKANSVKETVRWAVSIVLPFCVASISVVTAMYFRTDRMDNYGTQHEIAATRAQVDQDKAASLASAEAERARALAEDNRKKEILAALADLRERVERRLNRIEQKDGLPVGGY